MSHYTVLVVGDVDLEKALLPFTENCEEDSKQYFEFNSTEAEKRKEYEEGSSEFVEVLPGEFLSKWNESFRSYERGFESKYNYGDLVPKEIPFTQVYSSFEEYMKEREGVHERDETHGEYGYYTNPNAKWDWWTVGGRWTGFFKAKENADGTLGRSGAFGNAPKFDADIIRKGDVDFDKMTQLKLDEANKDFSEILTACSEFPVPTSWAEIRIKYSDVGEGIDLARHEYGSQPAINALRNLGYLEVDAVTNGKTWDECHKNYLDYVTAKVAVPYAILYNGEWLSKGEMGWFGVSFDETNDWPSKARKFIDDLPDDTLLTIVDCHI